MLHDLVKTQAKGLGRAEKEELGREGRREVTLLKLIKTQQT